MPLIHSTYQKPFYLWNAHWETMFPAIFSQVKGVQYIRERIQIFDSDFLDLDWSFASSFPSKKLVILTHGLEGNTQCAYIQRQAKIFNQSGYDALAWNLRGCSGEPNRLPRFYHSGASEDLNAVLDFVLQNKDYQQVILIGFSLGANLTLKYLGEKGKDISPRIKTAIVFSVPLHLSSCSASLRKRSNYIYQQNFKNHLFQKIRAKAKLMPDKISTQFLPKIKTLKDFDDYYTAPLHGFTDAEDYYEKSSSLYFVGKITIPTLIINAQNDPILAPACFPYDLLEKLENVFFETPKTGGHCGFSGSYPFYWSELRAMEWVKHLE
jgi:uncharacterized protein